MYVRAVGMWKFQFNLAEIIFSILIISPGLQPAWLTSTSSRAPGMCWINNNRCETAIYNLHKLVCSRTDQAWLHPFPYAANATEAKVVQKISLVQGNLLIEVEPRTLTTVSRHNLTDKFLPVSQHKLLQSWSGRIVSLTRLLEYLFFSFRGWKARI